MTPETVVKVISLFAFDTLESLFVRVDQGQLRLFVQCSDTFWWGTSDCEEITEDNWTELERAMLDLEEIGTAFRTYGAELFCARVRSLRPQGAVYKVLPEEVWPLFDACGEEREVDACNPVDRGTLGVVP